MKRTLISQLKEHIGKEVRIRGRVDTVRDQGKIIFLLIKDTTGIVQCVAWQEELIKQIDGIGQSSIVDITGNVKNAKQVAQGYEIEITSIKADSIAQLPLPIVIEEEHTNNLTSLDQRLDYRYLDLRSRKNHLMLEIYSFLQNSIRNYCVENDFIEIQPPKIISAASEGGATVFEINYFDKKAYLAQSPQFHKQMAIASDLEKVFAIGPVFRAEKSFTTKHLTEFLSFDIEMAYIDSYKEITYFQQELIKYVLKEVNEKYAEKIKDVFNTEIIIPQSDFPYITIKEAKELLSKEGITSKDDGDFSPEEERGLGKVIKEKTGSDFFFVTNYPHKDRAFYHMKNPDNEDFALGYDLYYKGVEITTGAQREHRLEKLTENAKERGIPIEPLFDYFEYFKYGCPPHGGLGMGMERFLAKLLNFNSVLEVAFLPNTPNRLGKLIAHTNSKNS